VGKEVEHKYLLKSDDWRDHVSLGVLHRQGYLSTDPERSVRVRVAGAKAFVTIKGKARGAARDEFEYEIPVKDGEQLLRMLCLKPLIEKTRYTVHKGKLKWEIDEFAGENRGLVIAEVETPGPRSRIAKPGWVGREVTSDSRYSNINLTKCPFKKWS
jgi:adenylate cyclase